LPGFSLQSGIGVSEKDFGNEDLVINPISSAMAL
jgi:hypothetical protein